MLLYMCCHVVSKLFYFNYSSIDNHDTFDESKSQFAAGLHGWALAFANRFCQLNVACQ